MAIKVFLDTNIVLDILDDKRSFHPQAVKLYRLIEDYELNAFISESVLTNSDYILQKIATKPIRLSMLSQLLDFVEVLPCITKTCLNAFQRNVADLEDALLYQVALEANVDYFITNDSSVLKKLSSSSLPVVSTKEFLTINK